MEDKIIDILQNLYNDKGYNEINATDDILALFDVTQWVAVEDKMPKEGERVLIYDGEYVCVGVWHGNMWANDDTWLYANDVPKKWKPLPNPPCG